ncbi:MAG: hypothetical protein QM754_05695 [Tepidisphaeraceae bacterium]
MARQALARHRHRGRGVAVLVSDGPAETDAESRLPEQFPDQAARGRAVGVGRCAGRVGRVFRGRFFRGRGVAGGFGGRLGFFLRVDGGAVVGRVGRFVGRDGGVIRGRIGRGFVRDRAVVCRRGRLFRRRAAVVGGIRRVFGRLRFFAGVVGRVDGRAVVGGIVFVDDFFVAAVVGFVGRGFGVDDGVVVDRRVVGRVVFAAVVFAVGDFRFRRGLAVVLILRIDVVGRLVLVRRAGVLLLLVFRLVAAVWLDERCGME